jgi:cold shock CspA family protein
MLADIYRRAVSHKVLNLINNQEVFMKRAVLAALILTLGAGHALAEEGTGRLEGTVKFYSPEKGFGSIDYNSGSFHVHQSGIRGTITGGDTVTFDLEEQPNGSINAVNVQKE